MRRAQRQVVDAKAHAQVSGAPGGVTAALYESEAQFDVCKWRVSSIRAEQASIANPPLSRAYAGSCVMGYRVFILGGWTRDTAMKDLVALDLEVREFYSMGMSFTGTHGSPSVYVHRC